METKGTLAQVNFRLGRWWTTAKREAIVRLLAARRTRQGWPQSVNRGRSALRHELATARQIQQALLPKSSQHSAYVQMTGINQPCLEVGGDYFDMIELGQDGTAFVIADVSGKGLGAALVTAMLQGSFSTLALGQEPMSVCAHINRFLGDRGEVHPYATLFVATLNPAGRLDYINAGHVRPLLIRDGRVEPVCPASCFPLGLFPKARVASERCRLERGDTLFLYTDGITDAMNPHGEPFGLGRLQEVLTKHSLASIERVKRSVLLALENFCHNAYQTDDLTLLIVRYLGEGPREG